MRGLDPQQEFTNGGDDEDGVVDKLQEVIAVVGSTDTTSTNYALSLHKKLADKVTATDTLQDKFDSS